MPKLAKNAPKKEKKARTDAEFKKFGAGKMHSGSKHGPIVTNPKQAQAIALSEAGESKRPVKAKKAAKKKKG